MLLYLGLFVLLILPNQDKTIKKDVRIMVSSTDHSVKYKNSNNNDIEINSYCKIRTCVLKCCPDGKDLNSEGQCYNSRQIERSSLVNNNFINVYKWSEKPRELNLTNTKMYQAFVENDQLADFHILKDGFLNIKIRNDTKQWVGAAPLDFCVNHHLADAMHKHNLAFVSKPTEVAKDTKKDQNTDYRTKYVAVGMVVSLLLIGFIFYRIRSVLLRIMSLVSLAFIFTVTAAYVTTSVQLLALRARIFTSTDCRIMSPFVYFFVLSIFFWANVMSFNTWWMISNFRKHSLKINKEVNFVTFIRCCVYGWLIPFLMTVAAIFVDIFDDTILIVKPPFDNCLTNEFQMFLYMYIPITVLTATSGLFYLLKLCNIWMLQSKLTDIHEKIKFLISKRRYGAQLKIYYIICVSAALILIPNVPTVIMYAINAYNIAIGISIYILFKYERCVYGGPYVRWDFGERLMGVYRKLTGAVTTRSTEGDIGDNNIVAHEENSMSSTIITT